ncbi:MAG: formylglycine-generating enzyme family protein, partial [Planctomycetota bacterium]
MGFLGIELDFSTFLIRGKNPALLTGFALAMLCSCSGSSASEDSGVKIRKYEGGAIPKVAGTTIRKERGMFRNDRDDAVLELISEGYFPLGRDAGSEAEGPAHEVFLDSFFLYRHEVTRAMYATYLTRTGREYHGAQLKKTGDKWTPISGESELPLTQLTWHEARAYAQWAGGDLPTEAQWEASARGEGNGPYPWGAELPGEDRCNCKGGPGKLTPVGTFPRGRSPFGCHDMGGNAAEWCLDT